MGQDKHVLVIGAGVIGLATAYYCLRRGHRVTVVDREPAEHEGCSFGNAGMIVPSHFVPLAAPGMVAMGLKWMWNPESPFYVKPRLDWDLWSWGWKFWRAANAAQVARSAPLLRDLHLASRACFEELAAQPGQDFGLVQKGLVALCRTQHALDEEARSAEQARALGVPAEVLDARQTAQLDPNVTMDVAGSVYFPRDCHLSPNRFMAGLKREVEQGGAQLLWKCDVRRIHRRDTRIVSVQTPLAELAADEFVLCGGSWSPLLARELGLRLPMQAGKGYSLTLAQPRELPQICAIFTEARVAATPMGTSLRFGGTMEMSGLNEDIDPARVQGIIKSVPKYYPKFGPSDFAGVTPWRGLRPCSPDGLPYLGRPASFGNLTIATGHAMMGLSLGPITGKLVSEIVSDAPTSLEVSALRPDRY